MKQDETRTRTTTTFIDNLKLPVHGWYRYTAGFSAQWAESVIESEHMRVGGDDSFKVLDPFAGSGTTMLAADQVDVSSIGFESHPLVNEIAAAKLAWDTDAEAFAQKGKAIADLAASISDPMYEYPAIVEKCYSKENLQEIDKLRKALERSAEDTPEYKLAKIAFICILRSASHAGTATWQYVLPNKTKAKVSDTLKAYLHQIDIMASDLIYMQNSGAVKRSEILKQDSRKYRSGMDNSIDLVLTSPPYANNYDYADATRLELSVLGDIKGWGDLQDVIRPGLVRSCSQMVSKEKGKTFEYLEDPILSPIHDEIIEVCQRMDEEKEHHGGKKNYHTMVALYFLDLAHVFKNLRAYCKDGSRVCFVVGDSAPYGIYVPVDEWLGRLAQSVGFKSFSFDKTRDRNIKWKNRKHRVPLKEGYLWIEG